MVKQNQWTMANAIRVCDNVATLSQISFVLGRKIIEFVFVVCPPHQSLDFAQCRWGYRTKCRHLQKYKSRFYILCAITTMDAWKKCFFSTIVFRIQNSILMSSFYNWFETMDELELSPMHLDSIYFNKSVFIMHRGSNSSMNMGAVI